MRRIISVLAVMALMAAMMAVSAMPAFAAPSCEDGQKRATSNADDEFAQTGDFKYLEQGNKHFFKEFACHDDEPPGGI